MISYVVLQAQNGIIIHLELIAWTFLTFLVAEGFQPVTIES